MPSLHCIYEIHCLALDVFGLNTVHQLSSNEKKISAVPGFEPGAAGWEARMHTELCLGQAGERSLCNEDSEATSIFDHSLES